MLAITRDSVGITTPLPTEPLHAGDVLAMASSADPIEAARSPASTVASVSAANGNTIDRPVAISSELLATDLVQPLL